MGRPTNSERRARKTEQALREFADSIPELLCEIARAARDKETPPSVRVQMLQCVDRLTALLPTKLPEPEPETADPERAELRAALTRLAHDGYGSDQAFEKRRTRCAAQLAALESEEAALRVKVAELESLKARYHEMAENRPLGTPSAASDDAAAPAPDPPPATLPDGAPPERTMLPSERGRRDAGRHEW